MISRVLFVGCILSVCSCGSTTTESAATSPEPQAATVVSVAENSFAVQDELPKRPFVEVQPIKFVEGREELPGYSPEAIELVVEPLQSAVLPYQAVVIRASIVNRTDKIVGPVADEMGVGISNGKPVNGRPWKVVTHGNSSARSGVGSHCVMLGPRQRLSVDVAFGHTSEYRSVATDNNRRVSETVIEPVFFADRSPTLEAHYHGVWMRTEDDLRSEFALQLADPTGDDLACFERLKADPRLARCLYDLRAIPDAAQVSLLEEIIKSWPRSSYADYVRLALARARLGVSGERLPRLTRPWLIPADGKSKHYFYQSTILQRQVSPLLPQADYERVIDQLSPSSKSVRERFATGIRAQSHLTASLDERRQAVALIDAIRLSTFPFAADALILKHRLLEIDEPERLPSITKSFDRDRPLSVAWLRLLAASYDQYAPNEAAQAWVNYRIRTSNSP